MWKCAKITFDTDRPLIMGILNVTPDSFFDGGSYDQFDAACAHARLMVEQGASIIDVGGESTRPESDEVSIDEELARVVPVVTQLASEGIVVSIDTRHASVARACVQAGAAIINDISGFRDQAMIEVAAACDAGIIVVHMLGEPKSMQAGPHYDDVVREVRDYLCERAHQLEAAGIAHERISIDPGPGFGKTYEHNLALLHATPLLASLGYPLVAAWSRKAFIGQLSGGKPVSERLIASVAVAAYAASRGANILRVHDVAPTVEALKVHAALRDIHRVFIGLGSNLGDAASTLTAAMEKISALSGVTLLRSSSLYESEPAYRKDQEMFCNAVVEVQTELTPIGLLRALQGIEDDFGRSRDVVNGPRTLDLDIIDYEGVVSDDPELLLPHPLALERDFIVTPLLEIAPNHILADGSPVTREGIEVGKVKQPKPSDQPKPTKQPDQPAKPDQPEASKPQGSQSPQGILSICATPIGNLGDITKRVVDTLAAADVVLAEDTRVARRLLSHLNIRAKLERCDENTIRQRSPQIIERIRQGSRIAFISDAGTPAISDPGAILIAAAQEAACPVEVLPGASAVLAAVVASGFSSQAFYFGGFLPRKKRQITERLKQLAQLDASLVFFESPQRVALSLAVIAVTFPDREGAIARELTKVHEEVLRAPLKELAEQIARREESGQSLKGELVVVIGPPPRKKEKRIHTDRYAIREP